MKITRLMLGKLWFQQAIIIVLSLVLLSWISVFTPAALANVTQHIEAPGQSLVKAKQTAQDQNGSAWQIIVFRQLYPDRSDELYLRLVGFPGVQTVDRQRSLALSTPRLSLTAPFDPGSSTRNQISPEPYIVQYGLQSIIETLTPDADWQLGIPVQENRTVVLKVPGYMIQEWKMVAQRL
jgi:Protein of unknown function (DUF3122)